MPKMDSPSLHLPPAIPSWKSTPCLAFRARPQTLCHLAPPPSRPGPIPICHVALAPPRAYHRLPPGPPAPSSRLGPPRPTPGRSGPRGSPRVPPHLRSSPDTPPPHFAPRHHLAPPHRAPPARTSTTATGLTGQSRLTAQPLPRRRPVRSSTRPRAHRRYEPPPSAPAGVAGSGRPRAGSNLPLECLPNASL